MLVLRARKSQELIQSSVLRPSLPCSLECGCCYGFPIGAGAPGQYGDPWWECGCCYGWFSVWHIERSRDHASGVLFRWWFSVWHTEMGMIRESWVEALVRFWWVVFSMAY